MNGRKTAGTSTPFAEHREYQTIDSSKQSFFISDGNLLFHVWGDEPLATSIKNAFQEPRAASSNGVPGKSHYRKVRSLGAFELARRRIPGIFPCSRLTGAPHLACFSRDVGYHSSTPATLPLNRQLIRFVVSASREKRARCYWGTSFCTKCVVNPYSTRYLVTGKAKGAKRP
jgi:hypothetical protein